MRFQLSCFATLLKSHLGMGVREFAAYFQNTSGGSQISLKETDQTLIKKVLYLAIFLLVGIKRLNLTKKDVD